MRSWFIAGKFLRSVFKKNYITIVYDILTDLHECIYKVETTYAFFAKAGPEYIAKFVQIYIPAQNYERLPGAPKYLCYRNLYLMLN